MHSALAHQEHRPWPIPDTPWTWRQSWRDLLFAHWPVPTSILRPLVPMELELEELDGSAWLGLVPFRMTGVMRRALPDVPGISAFPELNVRTYVKRGGKAGVWFLSLDAASRLAVWAARRFFHLPYYFAEMSLTERDGRIHYRSNRAGATLVASYRPTSDPFAAQAGSLEHWLTERYCLYAQAPNGSIWCNDVHHQQWPLQSAEAQFEHSTMLHNHGVHVEGPPPLLHFSRRLDVIVWNGQRVA